jgi:hypothetical protein
MNFLCDSDAEVISVLCPICHEKAETIEIIREGANK